MSENSLTRDNCAACQQWKVEQVGHRILLDTINCWKQYRSYFHNKHPDNSNYNIFIRQCSKDKL